MDPALLIAVRLSNEGHGRMPMDILRAPCRHVLAMLTYSEAMNVAQETASELNREQT